MEEVIIKILLFLFIIAIIGLFILAIIRKKVRKEKVFKLAKYIVLSFGVCYIFSNIADFTTEYISYSAYDKVSYEEKLKEIEKGIKRTTDMRREELIKRSEADFETGKYLNAHPELKELDKEKYEEISVKIANYIYENKLSISELVDKIQENDVKVAKDLYYNSYSKDEILNIIELMKIRYKYNLDYSNIDIEWCRKIVEKENFDIDEEIKKLQKNDLETMEKFSNGDFWGIMEIKYPYAMILLEEMYMESAQKMYNLIYCIIIGIFIGVVIYIYTETSKLSLLGAISILELVLAYIIEEFTYYIKWSGIILGNSEHSYSVGSNGEIISFVLLIITVALIAKAISNRIAVMKLNKLIK